MIETQLVFKHFPKESYTIPFSNEIGLEVAAWISLQINGVKK